MSSIIMTAFQIEIGSQTLTLLASNKDPASKTIAEQCQTLDLPVFLLPDTNYHLYCQEEDLPESDNYLVLSRHSSSSGTPAFTCHSVGNFSSDKPKLGGLPHTLCPTNADFQTALLQNLNTTVVSSEFKDVEVVFEVTHHGPYLPKPTIYIEMGSSTEIWENAKAGKIIALTIQNFVNNYNSPSPEKTAIAFGGTHYARKFSKLALQDEYNIGHISAKYSLPYMDEHLVKQMLETTISKYPVEYALFEKKGMKRKQEIKEFVKNADLDLALI